MKRIGALLALSLILILTGGSWAMGAAFGVETTSPEDGATGQSVDNMGFKVTFTEPVYSKKNQKANAKRCHLIDEKGRNVPHRVSFSSKEPNLMLVVADTSNGAKKKAKIKSETQYTLIIDKGFKAAGGASLKEKFMTSFTTLNQRTSMWVSMGMMGVMVVGMLIMTTRETKRQIKEKEEQARASAPVNPYKEAKRTGKTVEEVVAEEKKKKEKAEQKARKAAEKAARHKKENKKEISSDNLRVPGPRPISEAGSTYRYEPPKPVQTKSKSTNPKNKSGKQKNKKKKS